MFFIAPCPPVAIRLLIVVIPPEGYNLPTLPLNHQPLYSIQAIPPFHKTVTMRKLKLQIHMTIDGFVARPEGQTDWMWISGTPDPAGLQKVIELADSCDTILMGRVMSRGFIDYWEKTVDEQADKNEPTLAKRMVDMPKIIFSHTQTSIQGRNAQMENRDPATVVKALKEAPGKDLMVYGGANFVSSLISLDLIDEYYIFRNPVAIGQGLPIFKEQKALKLVNTITYTSGKILEHYLPG